ncbi:hypothetical protein SAMN05216229_11265 [Geopseudomonas sagittaria]|uniref:Uncharacterized protein n=1 Tax=Geopseudomonas sagittaria TaxID=1135990 RepID=A0A1I5W2X2_9GAMM|nr:hypothetical protein [Pseudomonas sagittaria]SFQ14060.1 hypothetical protein SAMN05216229_11265 [Pseudomonas sagittaria]
MPAFVEHKFEKAFLLTEENLRKIHELVRTRLEKLSPPQNPEYRVYRGDSYSYTTENIQDVLNEDNDDWRSITRLEVLCQKIESFELRLEFSKSGVELLISGDDRDSVFLLFSDLREYMQNEVLLKRKAASNGSLIIFMVAILAILSFTIYSSTNASLANNPEEISQALTSSSELDKLDFLINDRASSSPSLKRSGGLIAIIALVIISLSGVTDKIIDLAFPKNLFLFGKRKISFERNSKLLNNILWVVIVGFLVSMIAGLILWKITT